MSVCYVCEVQGLFDHDEISCVQAWPWNVKCVVKVLHHDTHTVYLPIYSSNKIPPVLLPVLMLGLQLKVRK